MSVVGGIVMAADAVLGVPAFGFAADEDWRAQLTTPDATGHEVGGLSVDSTGDIYVVGSAHLAASKWDMTVSKFSAAGAPLWQKLTDGGAMQNDFGLAVASDSTGVVVAGLSSDAGGQGDFLTLRRAADGALEWSARYDGPAGAMDVPVAVAIGPDGSVIVAGHSAGLSSSLDFAVVRYSSSGTQLWEYRYDGPGLNVERLASMLTDQSGNVYVTGTSDDVAGRSAIATLKLNGSGELVWEARFLPPASDESAAAAGLALDSTGKVIVTGSSGGEAVTLKYGLDGGLLWTARYRGAEPSSMIPVDVKVDGDDNAVVGANLFASGVNDSVVVKYDPAGHLVWASRISGPVDSIHHAAMAVDAAGNAYLTGALYPDVLTVRVSANGNQAWRTTFNSTGLFSDLGEFLQVDSAGHVIVAGRSIFFTENFVSLVRYSQRPLPGVPSVGVTPVNESIQPGASVTFTAAVTGDEPVEFQWRRNGRPIEGATSAFLTIDNASPDDSGDYSLVASHALGAVVSSEAQLTVLVPPTVSVAPTSQTAHVGTDGGFRAYAAGTGPFTYQWHDAEGEIEEATDAVLRLNSVVTADAGEYWVVVTSPAGSVTSAPVSLAVADQVEQLWALRHNGPRNGAEADPLLRVTEAGDVVVTARSAGAGTGEDILTAKFSGEGALLWSSAFNRSGGEPDAPADLAIDPSGNIIVTGWSGDLYTNRAFTTIKYDADGGEIWVRHFREPGLSDSFATRLAVDGAGNVTIAGRSGATPIVVRYDAAGTELWVARGAESGYDESASVIVDEAGFSYLGTTAMQNGDSDFLVRKLDGAGSTVWTQSFDAGAVDHFGDLVFDSLGNVVVAGWSFAVDGQRRDTIVVKFTAGGTRLWSAKVDAVAGENDFTRALAAGPAGDVYAVASIEDQDDDQLGTAVTRVDSAGQVMWTRVQPDFGVVDSTRLAVDRSGKVLLTGTASRPATGGDMATMQFDGAGTLEWRTYLAGPRSLFETGTAVALSGNSDVYVVGQGGAWVGEGTDLLLVRYRQQSQPGEFRVDLERAANGTLRLVIPTGVACRVEVSSDLVHWAALEEADQLNSLLTSGLAAAPFPERFYRLVRTGSE